MALAILACLGAGGCAGLPESGPTSEAVEAQVSSALPYTLVPITPAVVATLDATEPNRLAGAFPPNRRPARISLGVGDVVAIAIYEAAVGGLFLPGDAGARPSNNVSLPNQALDNAGNISFPFGGLVHAAGLTTAQLQAVILNRIKDRAIDPQVIVSVVSQQSSLVSVEGEVRRPLRYPASLPGAQDRISDAITRAGGLLDQGYESWVTLERAGRTATMPFEALLTDRDSDIFVQPGDRITITREPQRFIALGAFGPRARIATDPESRGGPTPLLDGAEAEVPFDAWRLNLAEAVAKAGGLLDIRADAGAVYLYRREPAAVAARLGVPHPLDVAPVIFRLDLSDPAGFVLATRFPMRSGDLLYVANARSVEVTKALTFFGAFTSAATNLSSAALLSVNSLRGSSSTGLPTVGGLTVVPSGVAGLPGTTTVTDLGDGVSPTSTATGGTQQPAGTTQTGQTSASKTQISSTPSTNATVSSTLKPRAMPTQGPGGG